MADERYAIARKLAILSAEADAAANELETGNFRRRKMSTPRNAKGQFIPRGERSRKRQLKKPLPLLPAEARAAQFAKALPEITDDVLLIADYEAQILQLRGRITDIKKRLRAERRGVKAPKAPRAPRGETAADRKRSFGKERGRELDATAGNLYGGRTYKRLYDDEKKEVFSAAKIANPELFRRVGRSYANGQ